MKLVTVVTHSDGYFPWLLQSCKRFGIHLEVLGWEQRWQGFAWRLTLMIHYLRGLDPRDIVCFIDGYDVIVLKPLQELEARFKRLKRLHPKCKVFVAEERHVHTVQRWGSKLTFGTCNNVFLNAGTYIGYARDILEIIQNMYAINPKFNADDQQMLLSYCAKHPQDIYVDRDSQLFFTVVRTLQDIEDVEIVGDPCIFHGASNTNMNNFIQRLGYAMTDDDKKKMIQFHWASQRQKVIYYIGLFGYILICMMVFAMILMSLSSYLRIRSLFSQTKGRL
jgi:hypothetical protein